MLTTSSGGKIDYIRRCPIYTRRTPNNAVDTFEPVQLGMCIGPAGVTQEEGHTGFLLLPSAVLALIFSREKDSAVPFPRRR